MNSMWQYCGTIQTVDSPVYHFIDERDSFMLKANGIAIPEGLNCKGKHRYSHVFASILLRNGARLNDI